MDDPVLVSSVRARVNAFATVTTSVQPGQVFMSMHDEPVNRLTMPSFDPYSRQPSYKASAVAIQKDTSNVRFSYLV